jgi:superfamily II DNA or RNA helicase
MTGSAETALFPTSALDKASPPVCKEWASTKYPMEWQMPYLVDEQPLYTGAMSVFPWTATLEDKFRFISRFGDQVNMSHREGNLLYVPRGAAPMGKQDFRKSYPPHAINCAFTPRNDEQLPCVEKSLALLRGGVNHVLNAPTGWGKSVVGGVIAARLGQPTLIVVNKQDLMDSWYDALVNVLQIPVSMIGRIQQNTCDWEGKRIVIGMLHSLVIPDRYPPEMYRYFGFVLVDEVDTVPTATFGPIFQLFPALYRLGVSATTDRKDGKWKIVTYNIGPVMVRGTMVPMSPKILIKQTKWRIPRRQRWENGTCIEEPIPYAPGRMGLVTKIMAHNTARNMEIVEFTKATYDADRRTLILCDTREHLTRLFQMLASAGIPGNHIGYYVGGMTKNEREASAKAQVILGTYKMVDRGTNVPWWDSLVFGIPHSDIRQSLGRILRAMNGKKQPVALDLVDADKIFQTFHMSRLTQYYALKADIVRMP